VEEVVRLEIQRRQESGDRQLLEQYHQEADPLYRLGPERRQREFALLHRRLFQRLGFEGRAAALLGRYRAVLGRIEWLALLRAARTAEEGADLGAPSGAARPAMVRVLAARFLSPPDLARFLDHEITHLDDLLSPEFGHAPEALASVAPHRRRLTQERYRLAWAISVDGRLSRQGRHPMADRRQRREELARCLSGLAEADLDQIFATLWEEDRPTHAALMAVAQLGGAGASREAGGACPLCGCPTHRWADQVHESIERAIRRDSPGWERGDGLCERCAEMYDLRCQSEV
jgi:hypothetical protein